MATRLPDGSIKLRDGRTVFANSLVQAQDLIEILDLIVPCYIPAPSWPFISGGGGGDESVGGTSGGPGPAGPAGSNGAQGAQGPADGAPGPQGNQGPDGADGVDGATGAQGFQGDVGAGFQGAQGNDGALGPQGNAGTQGFQGFQGDMGAGFQGAQGLVGAQGIEGGQGIQGFQGASGAGPDIFAATRVVSLVAGEGTDLTIAAAIAALPAEGGKIFVKEGTYPIAATLTLPDKNVAIEGAGDGTIISLGANAIAAFTIPTGLVQKRVYEFEDFQILGTSVANQRIWSIEDANGYGVVKARNVDSTGIQFPIDITDGFGPEPVTLHLDDCQFRPIAGGSSILINTPALAAFTTHAFMQRVWFYDELADAVTGALTAASVFEAGIGIFGEDCVFSIGTGSILNGLELYDSHIYNLGGGANPVITILDDSFGLFGNSLVGCTGLNVSFQCVRTQFVGGVYSVCAFVASSIGQFIGVRFTGNLTADAAVIIGDGSGIINGCFFGGRGTSFVLDGNFAQVVGNTFAVVGGGYTAVIRTTNGTAIIADNKFSGNAVAAILEAGTTSTNRIDNNQWTTNPTLLADSDAVVNEFKRKNITGQATVDALTAIFIHENAKGLAGAGSIKNTGAASLTVRRTVTDGYGITDFQEDVVLAGAVFSWPMDTAIGTALPSYVSFTVSVRSTAAGVPTTFDLRHSSTGAY